MPPDALAARRRVGVMLQVGRVPETLTVREHVHLFASYYATGQPINQRALFALAICGNPDLLVLDEPMVGLMSRLAVCSGGW